MQVNCDGGVQGVTIGVWQYVCVCGRKRRLCIKARKKLGVVEQGDRDQESLECMLRAVGFGTCS